MTTQVTIEDAQKCPKCGAVGAEVLRKLGPRPGSLAYTFNCVNQSCTWFQTGWVVQVNADGTIPERQKGVKDFPNMTPTQERIAQRFLEQNEREMRTGEADK